MLNYLPIFLLLCFQSYPQAWTFLSHLDINTCSLGKVGGPRFKLLHDPIQSTLTSGPQIFVCKTRSPLRSLSVWYPLALKFCFCSCFSFPLLISFFFNWRLIALQYFVGLCHPSTWISHRYVYVPFLMHPPSHIPPPRLSQNTELRFCFNQSLGELDSIEVQISEHSYLWWI